MTVTRLKPALQEYKVLRALPVARCVGEKEKKEKNEEYGRLSEYCRVEGREDAAVP